MITDTQSYSLVIRDMLLAKLATVPFFATFTMRKTNKALQVQPYQLPYLGLYIMGEDMTPDGDANAGEIRFIHNLKLGFSVMILNNDPEACEAMMDRCFWEINNNLWRDPNLMNFIDTRSYPGGVGNPDNVRIEAVTKGSRRHVFGNPTLTNETPLGELQYEISIMYRTDWPPIIDDDLLEIGVRTGVKAGDTQVEMDQRLQTGGEYVFEPSVTERKRP
jgi:hypothetical protein